MISDARRIGIERNPLLVNDRIVCTGKVVYGHDLMILEICYVNIKRLIHFDLVAVVTCNAIYPVTH